MMISIGIAERLSQVLEQQDRTVGYVARRARMSPNSLRLKMQGQRKFTIDDLIEVSQSLGLNPVDILQETLNNQPGDLIPRWPDEAVAA